MASSAEELSDPIDIDSSPRAKVHPYGIWAYFFKQDKDFSVFYKPHIMEYVLGKISVAWVIPGACPDLEDLITSIML